MPLPGGKSFAQLKGELARKKGVYSPGGLAHWIETRHKKKKGKN